MSRRAARAHFRAGGGVVVKPADMGPQVDAGHVFRAVELSWAALTIPFDFIARKHGTPAAFYAVLPLAPGVAL